MNKMLAAALAVVVGATGCSNLKKGANEANPAPCPNVVVLNEAARVIEFNGEERIEDVAYTGEITGTTISCRYFGENPIDAEIEIDLALGKGPKGVDGQKLFKYFVAVTRKDLEVITKNEFVVPVEFKDGRSVVVISDDVDDIVIPRAGEHVSGVNFEIIIGFSLTREQTIFNRSGKSLKFPTLK